MDINEDITIELSEYEVKQIIANYVRSHKYKCGAKDVHILVGKNMKCYGNDDWDEEIVFKGCNVRVTK